MKIAIIGSGIAGLSLSIRLAHAGHTVHIYEKNDYVGGKLHAFEQDGFVFDAGPSLFTNPHLLEELFTDVNEQLNNYFCYQSLNENCRYFFNDGTQLTTYANQEQLLQQFEDRLEESKQVVKQYLQASQKVYTNIGLFFISHSLHKIKTYWSVNFLKALLSFKPSYILKNLHQYNQQTFKNKNTVQLFNRYATYNGSNPYQAPAMLSLIPYLELGIGTFYPTGGMVSITNALHQLAIKKGVKIFTNSSVQKILTKGNKVTAVQTSAQTTAYDLVVSNADVYFTYNQLIGNQKLASKVLQQQRSSSALVFYWGINTTFNQLGLHNILFSKDYKAEFDAIFTDPQFCNDVTVYINITSKLEANAFTPPNCENWFVMINVAATNNANFHQLIPQYKTAIINIINKHLKTNIEQHIVTEKILSPITIQANTNSYLGSIYGTSSNSLSAAFLRHKNFSYTYKNLFFVGGSVHPGGGIPLCLHSAAITAKIINQQ